MNSDNNAMASTLVVDWMVDALNAKVITREEAHEFAVWFQSVDNTKDNDVPERFTDLLMRVDLFDAEPEGTTQ